MITKLKRWWSETGRVAREIVAKRTAIVGGATVIGGALVTFDVIPADLSAKGLGLVLAGLGILQAVVTALWARAGTTPADPALLPTSSNGIPLVEGPRPS